jgi:hypothetical protein
MRGISAAGVAVVAAAALTGAASAAVGTSGSVTGSGFVDTTFQGYQVQFRITVAAHGGPTGATGHMTMSGFRGQPLRADVDCVVVVGNAALVVGTLTEPTEFGSLLVSEFVDNGNGAKDPPDAALGGTAEPNPFFDYCFPTFIDFSDAFPVAHGNYVVRSD